MTRYRFTVEFNTDSNPGKWWWSDMIDFSDPEDNTLVDWSTWNVEEVK